MKRHVCVSVSICGFLLLALSGCMTGNAGEAHVKFGVPGIFGVEKHVTEAKLTATGYREATGETKINILLFAYESSAKDLSVKEKPEPKTPAR